MELNFSRHEVRSLKSIAHLFPPSKGRTGIYVLRFANGQQYVGQAVNVVSRFAQHRRHWDDIVAIDFARVPHRSLDASEVWAIRTLEGGGIRLRNIHHATHVLGDRDIDLHITPDEQFAWLNGDDDLDDVGTRIDDPRQRAHGLDAFNRLHQLDSVHLIAAMSAIYLILAIPRPRETERTFWALSAAPSTNKRRDHRRLATVSVNTMETFVIGENLADEFGWFLTGFAVISPATLAHHTPLHEVGVSETSLLELDTDKHYHAAGDDQAVLHFFGHDGFREMISLPGFSEAARELVLRLMRKGPTFQWKAHNFQLADEVFRVLDDRDEPDTQA